MMDVMKEIGLAPDCGFPSNEAGAPSIDKQWLRGNYLMPGVESVCDANVYPNNVDPVCYCKAANSFISASMSENVVVATIDDGHLIVYGDNVRMSNAPNPECINDFDKNSIYGNDDLNEINVACCDDDGEVTQYRRVGGFSYYEAGSFCQDKGMEMCSAEQLYGSAMRLEESNYFDYMVWSRTSCTGYGTTSPPDEWLKTVSRHVLVYGDNVRGPNVPNPECIRDSAKNSFWGNEGSNEIHVACCSEDGARVVDVAEQQQRLGGFSYHEARLFCQDNYMRLCSVEQLYERPKTEEFDFMVWTRTECDDYGYGLISPPEGWYQGKPGATCDDTCTPKGM